jgi:hypothetical protein
MHKHLILYTLLLSSNLLLAQNVQVDTNAVLVIANGGLNLRSEPSKNAKKIANIPFGSTIKYLSDQSFNTDSIIIRHSDNDKSETIEGAWVQVEYQKMKGYVLDIYLYYKPAYNARVDPLLSNDYTLLYPGCDCNAENLYNPANWKWYGYFRDGKGKYKVEAVEISYYRRPNSLCNFIITASKSDSLSFIIGSKKGPLSKAKVVRGKDLMLYSFHPDKPIKEADLANASVQLIENKDPKNWKPSELHLIKGKKRQLLNRPEYDYPYEIKFIGDLDGDAKDDYIIHYGDKGSVIVLYLTSKAKSGNLIEQVAMFFGGYCC